MRDAMANHLCLSAALKANRVTIRWMYFPPPTPGFLHRDLILHPLEFVSFHVEIKWRLRRRWQIVKLCEYLR